jgi:hypothetical protein
MAELKQIGFNIVCSEPEGEWIYETLPALVSVDKYSIKADGLDTTVITAEVEEGTSELSFYDAETGELLTTLPVDTETNTVSVEISADSPGPVCIRAGHQTQTRKNEVIIDAVV